MRLKRSLPGILTALAMLAVLASPARAAIVDQVNTTLDTSTGLEWLDLTVSVNRSFFDVSSNLGAGGAFEGYRYATEEELVTFWTNAGIPDIGSSTAANREPVAALQALIGVTQISSFGPRSFGLTSFIQEPNRRRVSSLIGGPDTGTALPFSLSLPEGDASTVVGSYLVRPTVAVVPVPASVLLLVTGLTALVSLRRRRR